MAAIPGLTLDLSCVDRAIGRSVELLKTSFSTREGTNVGGWYHQLDVVIPGPTATAVALTIFDRCGERFDRFESALGFLQERQVSSSDPKSDGGWFTNTSFNRPVMESTGWVARFLGRAKCQILVGAPSAERSYSWLKENQNKDGGWGSLHMAPSRVWLTCMGLRALVSLNPYDDAIDHGLEWLLTRHNQRESGWGEDAIDKSTVIHTALVLLTVQECRPGFTDERLDRAYDWLVENVDCTSIDDHNERVESYNVAFDDGSRQLVWQTVLPHYALPYVLSAIMRNPRIPPPEIVINAFDRIIQTQLVSGHWPNVQGAGKSIWAVAPFVEALLDVKDLAFARNDDMLFISSTAVVIQRSHARGSSLGDMLRVERRAAIIQFLGRNWASILLSLSVVVGLLLVGFHRFEWKDYFLGLILPVALFSVQEIRQRVSDYRS